MAEPQKKSLFAKIKQWFGIGTVKVELEVQEEMITPNTGEIHGKVLVTGKGDHHIKNIGLVCREYWKQKEMGGKETQKSFEMGTLTLNKTFDIKNGETRTFEFSLPIHYMKSAEDKLIEKGGLMGAIGSMSASLRQKSDITLCATADVEGAAFDPNKIIHLNFRRP